ncbi:hypothetical protein BUE80_DR007509 [Diplocarpon rosae]|nr:hypothetical protein BUE80_DR007509 [Diplocarpon rosae]
MDIHPPPHRLRRNISSPASNHHPLQLHVPAPALQLAAERCTSHVIEKQCSSEVWGGDAAAGVCRDYKALWAMTLCGTVSTLAALALDVHTQRKTARRGVYSIPEDDRDIRRLGEKESFRVRSAGYESPREQRDFKILAHDSALELDEEIGYHNRYGVDEISER